MTTNPSQPELMPAVRSKLGALRRRIRRYVWLQGLAAAIAWLGLAFWVSLAVDWLFEPPPVVRGVLLGVVGLVLAAVVYRLILRRAFVRLTSSNMAMLLERHFPQFDESLVTAVELAGRTAELGPHTRRMLAHTCRQAGEPIGEVRLRRVFNPVPLRISVLAAVLLGASLWTFGILASDALGVWSRRSLLFSDELWPRSTRLSVEGFEGGTTKVARGSDLEVIAKADLSMPVVPSVVEIRYRTEDGGRLRATMSRVGVAQRAKDRFQEYSHTFVGVLAPIEFDVVGGDDAVRGLRIEVVDNPTLVEMVLDCRFPAYMDRAPRTLPVTSGVMQLGAGTEITIRATSNKDLVEAEIDDGSRRHVHTPEASGAFRSFSHMLSDFTEDRIVLFTLLDTDGIKSREPVRLTLVAVADEPPQVVAHLEGIGSAVTPAARLPVVGQVTDDYGVAKTWFEYVVDQKDAGMYPIGLLSGNLTEFELDHAMEIRDLKLTPGQKLVVSVKAADRCDLAERANVGTSERWLLDVVTPEQLRTMLEARELVLRQRFEQIIQEVTETRDSLVQIDFPAAAASDEAGAVEGEAAEPGEPTDQPSDDPSGDPSEGQEEPPAERVLALRTLRVGRAVQNCRKNAHETLGVAEAFADIREQLVNNRIDTVELKTRLEQGIANPLRRIAEEGFPELERRLSELEKRLGDVDAGPKSRDLAVAEADAILKAMQDVLQRMLELEDFNKAVELLREIIKAQEDLGEQTEQRHKERLRELLED